MTAWYTGGEPGLEPAYYAWTVRPDLWPPGSEVWVVGMGFLADWGHLAHLVAGCRALRPISGMDVPGAAEALILAGHQLDSMGGTWGQTWTPSPEPAQ